MHTERSEGPGGTEWLCALLQTADALFPTGAYAHSLGFEEMVRLGGVRNEATLEAFLVQHLIPALAQQELPYLRFAFDCGGELEPVCEIDAEIHAWKLARETREASIQLGVRRLKALRAVSDAPLLLEMEAAIARKEAHGHHLCICALQALTEGIPLPAALATYGYQTLAGACAAALKLIRIGQDGCQRALRNALTRLPDAVLASRRIERDDAGCFSPLLEIASMRHAFADERLFIS